MLEGTHHIAIIASDEQRALDFYINKLGFTLEKETWRPAQQDYLRMLRLGDTVIELFIHPDAPQRVTGPEALGLRHLAFRVESVSETVKELENLGISCEPVRVDAFTGKAMTFFHDPDGLPLELHE